MADVNPNLARHMADVVAKLTDAEQRGKHVHASVQYGACGEAYSGPVTEWDYIQEDTEGFGFLELVNYAGETVRKPLVNVGLHDIRPCWDEGCHRNRRGSAKQPRPGDGIPLHQQPDAGYDPYAGTGYDGD